MATHNKRGASIVLRANDYSVQAVHVLKRMAAAAKLDAKERECESSSRPSETGRFARILPKKTKRSRAA